VNGFFVRTALCEPSPAPITAAHTIAILPFTALDADDGSKSFAAGLQREILTRLTAQHVAAAAVTEAPATGELLTGTVQRGGNRVRINVQLVDATSDVPRGAQTYDREIIDILALESEIADTVAKSIAAK
jgi:TolB-like protein